MKRTETGGARRRHLAALILFVLLPGMCFGSVKAESSFVCAQTAKAGGALHLAAVLERASGDRDYCTEEYLGISPATSYLPDADASGKHGFLTAALLLALASFAFGRMFRALAADAPDLRGETCRRLMIRYIHNQDGSKG